MNRYRQIKIKWSIIAVAAILTLLVSHYFYRFLERCLQRQRSSDLLLATPLKQFPYKIRDWEGSEVPISDTVLKVAANDDYLSRSYVNSDRQLKATVYIAYTSEPRRMLGHRPRVCYVGSGWVHQETRQQEIQFDDGSSIPCLLHQFTKPNLQYQTVFVLNYYIINGTVSSDHKDFSGLRWRHPRNIKGRVDYVAQLQFSSVSDVAVVAAAREFSQMILSYFPKSLSVVSDAEDR